ncbi:hypothetical protein J7E70_28930 [Variovorax paradoxus]|nr:hypothetical protein [Variovorax paradoxus]MBT2304459.1 hypothetical protein [Variovorax paradoxus]
MNQTSAKEPHEAIQTLVARIDSMREASRLIIGELSRTLTGPRDKKLTLHVREAINELERQSIQELVDEVEPRRPAATRIDLEKRAIDAVLQGTEWSSAAEIGQRLDAKAANPHAAVSRWQQSGRIFGIDHRGKKIYPAYIFDATWQPLPAVKTILAVLEDSPFRVAAWFESTNSFLGGKRPREVIASAPEAVVAAAEDHKVGAVHG